MEAEDKVCFAQGGEELARAAYGTGFDDGFEAAVFSLGIISEELQKRDGVGLDPSIIAGLVRCKAKALACFGRDRFEVRHVPTVGREQ